MTEVVEGKLRRAKTQREVHCVMPQLVTYRLRALELLSLLSGRIVKTPEEEIGLPSSGAVLR